MNDRPSLILDRSPVVRGRESKLNFSLYMIVALTPSLVWACVRLGMRALVITLVCIASCLVFEAAYQLVRDKKTSVLDLSGVATGMLVAFTFPVTVPFYVPIVACFIATFVIKMLLGKYTVGIVNPVALAKLITALVWKEQTSPSYLGTSWLVNTDNITEHLPLTAIQNGDIPTEELFDLFFGNQTGDLGTVSVAMLLLGGVYLVAVKAISWHIPVSYLVSVLVATYLLAPDGLEFGYTFAGVCVGGTVFCAVFLATNSFARPITKKARIAYGIGCGLLTVILRSKTDFANDAFLAVFIMGLLTPVLDTVLAPSFFGKVKKR